MLANEPAKSSAKVRRGAVPSETTCEKKALPLPVIPLAPDGVEDLKFSEFFKTPIGPLGLELTEKLRAMNGKRVRVLGYMTHEAVSDCADCQEGPPSKRKTPAWMKHVVPGRLMLTPTPQTVNHSHYGLADDLPPQTVFVTVPDRFGEQVPFTPGLLLLTGTLSVGNQQEPDGRISVVRLTDLAPESSAQAAPPKPVAAR